MVRPCNEQTTGEQRNKPLKLIKGLIHAPRDLVAVAYFFGFETN